VAVALVLAVVLAGCGGDDGASGAGNAGPGDATAMTGGEVSPTSRDAARPSSTGDGVGSSTTDVDGSAGGPGSSLAASPEEAAVLAAVDCYWATIVEASNPPNPSHPGFDRCFTGEARSRSVALVRQLSAENRRVVDPTGLIEQSGRSVTIDADAATVNECTIDDGEIRDDADNVVSSTVYSAHITLELVNADGLWKVRHAGVSRSELGSGLCGDD
jgi:hypothetical protein